MSDTPKADDELISEAKERFRRCVDWETQARENARLDERFANGDAYNMWQWDQSVRNVRGDRPCLTHNKVRQHNLQIINDARQNKAQIKITPTGGRATYEAAQVFQDIIRRIEYQSKAIDAYSTAIYHQVESGIGYVRVDTDYADDGSFDLELFVRRIADWRSVYMDPDCKEYDKGDASFAFVFQDIPRDQYEKEFGTEDSPASTALDHTDGWNDREHVRVAEYWRRTIDQDEIHLLLDGRRISDRDIPDDDMGKLQRQQIVKSRKINTPRVEWFKISGDRVVDREDWPGKYIPIVPFIGEETVIDGVLDRHGHTRAMIDAQRIYNYWNSAAVEQVALQTKTPYLAAAQAIEGKEEMWQTANVKNWSVLIYNHIDDSGQPVERPQRVEPPAMASAYVQGMQIARDDLMSVSGQYQAELGMQGNERSGVAIQQRQRQGDTATYHYIDNQAKAIRQVGRILLDLIPKVYDVQRVIKIMAEDGTQQDVMLAPGSPDSHQFMQMQPSGQLAQLNPQQAQEAYNDPAQPNPKVIFNPNVGKYDVESDVGPAYGTRRQEAFNAFSQIMAQNAAAFPVVGDFWARNADFPGADELADRLERGLPPQYKPGPDPQTIAVQQQAQEMHQQAQQLLGKADSEIAELKAQVQQLQQQLKDKGADNLIKDYDAETRRLAAVGQIDPKSLQIIVRQLIEDMYGTRLEPMLQEHARIEQSTPLEQPQQPATVQ
jgi:hypothetical protein